jgi:hypothetical protein
MVPQIQVLHRNLAIASAEHGRVDRSVVVDHDIDLAAGERTQNGTALRRQLAPGRVPAR